MSSSSDDLLPLVNRVKTLANSQQPQLASDDDDDVPQWLRNYTSPQKEQQKNKRHKGAIMLTDSDSDVQPAAAPSAAVSKANAPQAGVSAPQPTAASPNIKHAPAALHGTKHTAAALLAAPTGANASQTTTPSNQLTIHLPDKLPRTKLLVELEPDEHGATDLAGDAGAVGRLLVGGNPGEEDIKVDLKGVVYEATVVSLPGTVCVINASGGGGDAKVEALFNDMVQLRPDVNNALMRQQEGMYNALMMDDDDDYAPAAGEGGAAKPAAKGRKKAETAAKGKAQKAKARKPATKRAGGGKAPPAKRAKKK